VNDPRFIEIESADPAIKVITLNRPEKRNALSVALIEQLRDAIKDAANVDECRAIILRGNGPVFCAGLDLKEAFSSDTTERSARSLADLYQTLALSPLITIAAAQGAAMGGGVGLLAACDFVVAADDLRIGFPEVRRGLVAALVTALLQRQLPGRVLRELILLGQTIEASRAQSIGLVNRVVPAAGLVDQAKQLAAEALQGAPLAMQRTKKLLDDLSPRSLADDLERALQYHMAARDSTEAAEGAAAFLEKREPRWRRT